MMSSYVARKVQRILVLVPLFLALLGSSAWGQSRARFVQKWLDVGDLAHVYSEAGAKGLQAVGYVYPYIMGGTGFVEGHDDSYSMWIGTTDWTDPDGEQYPHKVVFAGPVNDFRGNTFPKKFTMISRFEDPEVLVDGFPTEREPVVIDEVDPTIKPARKIVNVFNTSAGITVRRELMQFSQNHHDNYHIEDITLTNTGNVDGDEDIELPDQELTGVYFHTARLWAGNMAAHGTVGGGHAWGKRNVNAIKRDPEMGNPIYSWIGNNLQFTAWDAFGVPAIEGGGWGFPVPAGQDTLGRLVGYQFMGDATAHADVSPSNNSNDPEQPTTMAWDGQDHELYKKGLKDDKDYMSRVYDEYLASGIERPFQHEVVAPDGDHAHAEVDPNLGTPAGFRVQWAYGPYEMEPGESIHIVNVVGVDGLSRDAAMEIGKAYKRLWRQNNDYATIEFDADGDGKIEADESMDKNEWVMTGQDSLFNMFKKGIANYESGYSIPKPPKPPKAFRVTSGVDAITLEWELFSGSNPQGFEIYRAKNQYQGAVENEYEYELIHEAGAGERSYQDTEVVRGTNYYYYIVTVGEENDDATAMTPTGKPLKSNRYYTQTYAPARLKRGPGDELSDLRIVPNPLNMTADVSVRYSGAPRLGFLDIPGNCTIKIFTERGKLVETIEHTDGSGDEYWDLTTEAEQLVVSGLYLASIEDNDTGEQVVRKFVIVR